VVGAVCVIVGSPARQFHFHTTLLYNAAVKSRVITRIEVSPHVPKDLADTVERWGSTNVSVLTRLVNWLARQDEEIQAEILGHYPGGRRADLPLRVVKAIAKNAKNHNP
jgi:hypothetical protein